MDTKSKILFWVVGILIIFSISASYYRYMILHDYMIETQIDCDPSLESCFVWQCDPEVDGECTGNMNEDTWHYKYFYRNAKNIPPCDPANETCEALICPEGELECEYITCTEDTLIKYESEGTCTNASDFGEEEMLTQEENLEIFYDNTSNTSLYEEATDESLVGDTTSIGSVETLQDTTIE